MAKKRKASSHKPSTVGRSRAPEDESKLTINTYEDVADSEDEFFINRDKILLDEGPQQKKRRKIEEEGKNLFGPPRRHISKAILEPSDEEVFAEPSDVAKSDDEESQDDGQFSPKLIPQPSTDQRVDYATDASDEPANEEEDGDASNWGSSRKDYYNADPITTEADALEEEAEARRLQKKQLQGMTEADFGLDEIDWDQAKKDWTADGEDGDRHQIISEVLPKVEITDSMSPEEKLKILRTRYPEFEPLAKEYMDLHAVYQDLSLASKAATAVEQYTSTNTSRGSTVAAVKLNALGGYLAALCMYFALMSATDTNADDSCEPMEPSELHDHKIMHTLVRCRQLWARVKDMEIPDPEPSSTATTNERQTIPNGESHHLSDHNDQPTDPLPKPRTKRKSQGAKRAARALAAAQADSEARRLERLRKIEESLKDLSSLTALTAPSRTKPTTATATSTAKPIGNAKNNNNDDDNNDDSDLGEALTLTPQEAAQKALRKKSLRFYTSQIAQTSNRRDAAGRDAGGDADIPHRERIRDRQARLNAEAEARGRKKHGGPADAADADLDRRRGSGSEEEGEREQADLARDIRREDGDDDGYYDLVSARAADKKALKAARAEAAREGGVVRVVEADEEGVVGEDGKRGITYAIEKNRGLAPKRRKEVRNPRVKRRKKFEDKKKKLGSVRAVYKGGEGRGGYKGELTGIKGGLVRSIKL
ncbi:MAG: hypothetical protein Q9206_002648 [Seirophora lacunosa]